MDELTAVLKARDLVNKVNPSSIPVSVRAYVDHIGGTIRIEKDLGADEPGWSFKKPNGKYCISVNEKDGEERRRFTVCHELAHIILGLPSEHDTGPAWSYSRRPPNEILCDVFAAELLLPHRLFKPLVDRSACSLTAIDLLAGQFEASAIATGSRFAAMAGTPCAFVFSEAGKVRYSSMSASLRAAKAWIPTRMALPSGSVSERCRAGTPGDGPEEVEPDIWFEDWDRGGDLMEDARHLNRWDQTVALLWFEDEEVPPPREQRRAHEEEVNGLAELDGILPWPGRNKRRR